MNYYIGLDIGTSSLKAMLVNDNEILNIVSEDYPLSMPQSGWSEQNPEDWFSHSLSAIKKLTEGIDGENVRAVSFSGQMHGLVMLGENDEVIRPAILWNDGRSVKEVEYLNGTVGKDFLLDSTGNIAFAGFTLPKLLWVKNNEPENFAKIKKICLPKDYAAYMLSGVFATDVSDAAGTLYFDTGRRCWSPRMLQLAGIDESVLPKVYESSEAVGTIKKEIADKLCISRDAKIVIGAGDNAASAIGTGTVGDGSCNISLGTSGTIFVCTDGYRSDRENAIHTFCSANGKYHYLACTLTAASCRKWLMDSITGEIDDDAMGAYYGRSAVLFLPYLMGERSPVNDTAVRGMFAGISLDTSKAEIALSVLEGVAFSLKQNIEIIKSSGVKIEKSRICGGGAKSRLWLKIMATVLDIDIEVPALEHGGVLGACILAAQGCGNDISPAFYGIKETVHPDSELVPFYEEKYRRYLKMYPMAKDLT